MSTLEIKPRPYFKWWVRRCDGARRCRLTAATKAGCYRPPRFPAWNVNCFVATEYRLRAKAAIKSHLV
jgi:hypothetical protein